MGTQGGMAQVLGLGASQVSPHSLRGAWGCGGGKVEATWQVGIGGVAPRMPAPPHGGGLRVIY